MERRSIAIDGIVQGVGFRPYVVDLATRLRLAGFVRNDRSGVEIEVEGDARALDAFLNEIVVRPPPRAQIEALRWTPRRPCGESRFAIRASQCAGVARPLVAADVATCDACAVDLFDSTNRRFRHPFISCVDCGPRFTIVTEMPFDRQRTTMARFAMCRACRAEYDDPADRRFHAQTLCCHKCGPRLQLLAADGSAIETADPIVAFAAEILAGHIGALKGLGGFHLVCDARNESAVAALRSRKRREAKPLAVMAADDAALDAICVATPHERELLHAPQRPIVLALRRDEADIAPSVAPRQDRVGAMLPYTPLHHLLLDAVGRVPLVMTSANLGEEPIVYRDDAVRERLAGVADVFLTHDRPIQVRCDDSVAMSVGDQTSFVRRSRGYAPHPVKLAFNCPEPILAVGGQGKVTFALARDDHAFVSHHVGDLDGRLACLAFADEVEHYKRLLGIAPRVVAHDLHPDYFSTQYAQEQAREGGARLVGVQHHHAHLASCLAEHRLAGPALGVIFDGTGWGPDQTIWGGEFLIGDCGDFTRVAHLRQVALPGGEQAVREPWRVALAKLRDAGLAPERFIRRPATALRVVERMLDRGLNCPLTSSAGRLFDAVAALVGLRDTAAYEGEPAMAFEQLALRERPAGEYSFDFESAADSTPLTIDTRPLIADVVGDLARGQSAAIIARRFHSTVAAFVAATCQRLRQAHGIERVALSGGVFMNRLLIEDVQERLLTAGFQVYKQSLIPPNDGGLALGQLAVAAARMASYGNSKCV